MDDEKTVYGTIADGVAAHGGLRAGTADFNRCFILSGNVRAAHDHPRFHKSGRKHDHHVERQGKRGAVYDTLPVRILRLSCNTGQNARDRDV